MSASIQLNPPLTRFQILDAKVRNTPNQPKKRLNQSVFKQVHGNNLVYNTCWEDPRCDRELLELNAESRVVMITSAGCNALDYALDKPAEINCIDMNPRQNALLELKMSVFRNGNFDALFKMFGDGAYGNAAAFYHYTLRPSLPDFAHEHVVFEKEKTAASHRKDRVGTYGSVYLGIVK